MRNRKHNQNEGAPGSDDMFAPGASAHGDLPVDVGPVADDEALSGEIVDAPVNVGGTDVARQLDEQKDKYLRLAAEFDNYRRRSVKERAESGARAQGELVRELIDALDDLSRFAHVDPATTDATTVVQGVDMVERKMLKSLGGAGLEIIDPVDEPFDPAKHEAVATEPALSREDDHMVARVFQKGYLFGGQLLRPARVVVKQWAGG